MDMSKNIHQNKEGKKHNHFYADKPDNNGYRWPTWHCLQNGINYLKCADIIYASCLRRHNDYCKGPLYVPGSAEHNRLVENLSNARHEYTICLINDNAPNASNENKIMLYKVCCYLTLHEEISSGITLKSLSQLIEMFKPFNTHFIDKSVAIENLSTYGNLTDLGNQLLCAFFPGIQRLVNAGIFVSISLLDWCQLFECFKLSMLYLSNLKFYLEKNIIYSSSY